MGRFHYKETYYNNYMIVILVHFTKILGWPNEKKIYISHPLLYWLKMSLTLSVMNTMNSMRLFIRRYFHSINLPCLACLVEWRIMHIKWSSSGLVVETCCYLAWRRHWWSLVMPMHGPHDDGCAIYGPMTKSHELSGELVAQFNNLRRSQMSSANNVWQ